MNNILELLLKYYFHMFMTSIEIETSLILCVKHYLMRLKPPFEITRFHLFQNVNRNFFFLKDEQWVYIALAKILEPNGGILPFSFYGQPSVY